MKRIQHFLNYRYDELAHGMTKLCSLKSHHAHNAKRLRVTNRISSRTTYEGALLCGAASEIVQSWIPTAKKMYFSQGRYSNMREDHVHLRIKLNNETILIDPTWKQMLSTNYGQGDDEYHTWLFEENDPIFVGKPASILQIFDHAQILHKKTYDSDLSDKTDFWKKAQYWTP